jgi:hypothetical protein
MRTSVAAFALFRRVSAVGRIEYLAQWNEGWHNFHFVGGHKRDDESFRTCCVREVGEELGLVDGRDFRVAAEQRCQLRYTYWSERARTDTAYTVELFDAELIGAASRSVTTDPVNRWLSESDIRTGRCRDGRAVSATMRRILEMSDLLAEEFEVVDSDADRGWMRALNESLRRAHAERGRGRLGAARELLLEAIASAESAGKRGQPALAACCWDLAQIEQEASNLTAAVDLARRAHRLWREGIGEHDRRTQRALAWLAGHDPESRLTPEPPAPSA